MLLCVFTFFTLLTIHQAFLLNNARLGRARRRFPLFRAQNVQGRPSERPRPDAPILLFDLASTLKIFCTWTNFIILYPAFQPLNMLTRAFLLVSPLILAYFAPQDAS